MPSLNQVQLVGHLTRDPEQKFLPSGAAYAKFGLAVNRSWKKGEEWQEEVCFIDVTAWGKAGEWSAANLRKGSEAAVFGYLKHETWEKEGQKHSKHSVTALTIMGGAKGTPSGDAAAAPVHGRPIEDQDIPFTPMP